MTKKLAAAFGLGALSPVLFALWLGGENVAQAGLRLAAIEQGFALASHHWQFEATPAADVEIARWDDAGSTPATTKKATPVKKGTPRR